MNINQPPAPVVLHEKLLALCDLAVLQFDLDGQLNYASPSTVQLLGHALEGLPEVLGELIYDASHDLDAERLRKILNGRPENTVAIPPVEIQLKTACASVIWVEASCQVLRDSLGQPEGYAVYLRNIEKQKHLETQLADTTRTDQLTGLYNTKAFEDTAKREWGIALREQTPITLIKVALDGLSNLGSDIDQTVFDTRICAVARTLEETARGPADRVARVGKSEFAVLLPRTHESGAQTLSAFIHLTIQDLKLPLPVKTVRQKFITVSVGATCFTVVEPKMRTSVRTLLHEADECLVKARKRGGDQVVLTAKAVGSN